MLPVLTTVLVDALNSCDGAGARHRGGRPIGGRAPSAVPAPPVQGLSDSDGADAAGAGEQGCRSPPAAIVRRLLFRNLDCHRYLPLSRKGHRP